MERLDVKGPFNIGDVTLFVLERTWLQTVKGQPGLWLNGSKQANIIIICDTQGKWAIDMDSTRLDLADVVEKMPVLNELLNKQ